MRSKTVYAMTRERREGKSIDSLNCGWMGHSDFKQLWMAGFKELSLYIQQDFMTSTYRFLTFNSLIIASLRIVKNFLFDGYLN